MDRLARKLPGMFDNDGGVSLCPSQPTEETVALEQTVPSFTKN